MAIAVDGDSGSVQLRPSEEDLDEFRERIRVRDERRAQVGAGAGEPPVMPCGHRIEALVNVESVRDLETFPVEHVDGVGLLRTEFLYMERSQFPSEEEQYRLYRRVVEHMDGRPVTLRTLDIGADKQLPYFQTPPEANPALGWRGIRISIEWPDLMRAQLRAALRASAHGPVRLLLPMVGTLEQVKSVRAVFDGVRANLSEQGYAISDDVPVGVMIEVPRCSSRCRNCSATSTSSASGRTTWSSTCSRSIGTIRSWRVSTSHTIRPCSPRCTKLHWRPGLRENARRCAVTSPGIRRWPSFFWVWGSTD